MCSILTAVTPPFLALFAPGPPGIAFLLGPRRISNSYRKYNIFKNTVNTVDFTQLQQSYSLS